MGNQALRRNYKYSLNEIDFIILEYCLWHLSSEKRKSKGFCLLPAIGEHQLFNMFAIFDAVKYQQNHCLSMGFILRSRLCIFEKIRLEFDWKVYLPISEVSINLFGDDLHSIISDYISRLGRPAKETAISLIVALSCFDSFIWLERFTNEAMSITFSARKGYLMLHINLHQRSGLKAGAAHVEGKIGIKNSS